MNEVTQKILLLLYSGLAFGYAYTPNRKWRVIKNAAKEWKKINENELKKGIRSLYKLDIIDKKEEIDGWTMVKPTEKGKLRALNILLDNIKNSDKKWDGRWRMIAFDIPDSSKRGRDALRRKLNKIGFKKFQESVFITPYDCQKEMMALVDFFKLEKYVRFGILDFIDNELDFKKFFKIS